MVRRPRRGRQTAAVTVLTLVLGMAPGPAAAGSVVADLTEGTILESAGAAERVAPHRAAGLLLAAVVRDAVAAGALGFTTTVRVLPVPGDGGPSLAAVSELAVGELLQLLLLTGSRTAAKSLAAAVGPGITRARERVQHAAARLELDGTALADDWPGETTVGPAPPRRGASTAHDLARLALAVLADAELRRRIALDGVPIANGALIVRATAPLIHTGEAPVFPEVRPTPVAPVRPTTATPLAPSRIVLAAHDGLELLIVATGPAAEREVWGVAERALARYERVALVRAGQPVGAEIAVAGGLVPSMSAVAAESLGITLPRGVRVPLTLSLQLPTTVEAPVEVRQSLGELVVERSGRVFAVVPLVAPRAIAPGRWLDTARN